MRIPSSRRDTPFDQAMTPLIDVVFQLLIFFICASTGHLREKLLASDLAGVGTGPAAVIEQRQFEPVWIRLKREGKQTVYSVQNTTYDAEPLRILLTTLAVETTEIPVILDAAGEVPLEDVMMVFDLCRAVGYQSVNFAVHPDALPPELREPARAK